MTPPPRRHWLRVFTTAFAAAALAWVAGGQALLGRIDPALVTPLLLPAMLLLAWWQRQEGVRIRRRTALLTLLILAVLQGALASVLGGWVPWLQLAFAILAGGAAALLADALIQWRAHSAALRWLAVASLAAAWFGAGHALLAGLYRAGTAPPGSPAATVITGLPLRWSGGGDIAALIAEGGRDDPALRRLEAAGPVALADSLIDHVPPPGGALLLAHPRALAPQELVAIDAFVRGGGRAVILADALSGWPAPHPLGDPRNPPVTSLLTPLLDHWDITLGTAPVEEAVPRAVDVGRARLQLFSAGRFDRLPSNCGAFAGGRIASCRIGRGEAWLVGDADLLFLPLWRPPVSGAAHLRQADTMEWLSARLWRGAGSGLLQPVWIRARGN